MKAIKLLTIITILCLIASCGSKKKENKSKERRMFSSAHNEIIWTGGKVVGGEHTGTLMFKETNLEFDGQDLIGGSVVVDMTTMRNIDLEGEMRDKLEMHLLSEDFFFVSSYPSATLEIKKVTPTNEVGLLEVLGSLTIKGITNNQVFMVTVKKSDKKVILTTILDIDRSKYDVRYGSSSFFKGLGDKAINDIFTVDVQLVVDM